MPGIIVKLYMTEKDPALQPTIQSVTKSEETITSATLQLHYLYNSDDNKNDNTTDDFETH